MLVGKTLSFTHELFSYLLLSIRHEQPRVDGYQIYFGGSVVGRALTIGIEVSPTLP